MSDLSLEKWQNRVPAPGETCVFSSEQFWKRDALLFDRVYAQFDIDYRGTPRVPDIPCDLSFGIKKIDDEIWQYGNAMAWAISQGVEQRELGDVDFERDKTQRYWEQGIMATWSFGKRGYYLRRFSEGECVAYEGALRNLPIVTGKDASWQQIIEFRGDKEAVRKYRDLRIWLADGIKATSVEHATDIIGQKIDNYRWSIRKHGLRTITGAITQLFEWKQSSMAVAAGGVAGSFGGPLLGVLAGAVVALGQIGVAIAEQRISEDEILRGPDREIAILYEAQEKFGTGGE